MCCRILVFFLCIVLSNAGGFAQTDSLRANSLRHLHGDTVAVHPGAVAKKKKEHVSKPPIATLLSAVVPGAGQFYNKKYWKIPVIYAGFGIFGYFVQVNNSNYKSSGRIYNMYKRNYEKKGQELPSTGIVTLSDTIPYPNSSGTLVMRSYSADIGQVLENRNDSRRYRDLMWICFGTWYILNIIDANVDAHLYDFDVSDDLSLNWQPMLHYSAYSPPTIGARLQFRF